LAAALVARSYNATTVAAGTADLQQSDVIILTAATGGTLVYINNGGTTGTVADFTVIETPNLDAAAIMAMFSASNGISYDAVLGLFKLGGNIVENTIVDVLPDLDFKIGFTSANSVYHGIDFNTLAGSESTTLFLGRSRIFGSNNAFGINIGGTTATSGIIKGYR
jgi:hypothetical protein